MVCRAVQVARIVGVTEEQRRLMGVQSGLELITLPHGRQLRQDLLERYTTLCVLPPEQRPHGGAGELLQQVVLNFGAGIT